MNRFYFYRDNICSYDKLFHVECCAKYVQNLTINYLVVRGEAITQVRAVCEFCNERLDEVATQKYLQKRELEAPVRELRAYKIVKYLKKYALMQGKSVLLINVDKDSIGKYLLETINPQDKIKKLFLKTMKVKLDGIDGE